MRNHIKSRHVDFIIIGNHGNILAVIELDNKSHESEKTKHGHEIKNQILILLALSFIV